MKIHFQKISYLKQGAICTLSVLIGASSFGGPTITSITWNPSDPTQIPYAGVLNSYTGTLTQVAQKAGGKEAGQTATTYVCAWSYSSAAQEEDCCTPEDNQNSTTPTGKRYKIETSKINITIAGSCSYKLAEWADRWKYEATLPNGQRNPNARPNAVAEWDRILKGTIPHEKEHAKFSKSWATAANCQPVVASVIEDGEADCGKDVATAKKLFLSKLNAMCETAGEKLAQEEKLRDMTDVRSGYVIIDTTKDN